VVISSQATSARAANLIASFIIIPVAFLLQGEASLLLFGNFTALWLIALFLAVVAVLFVRLGVRIFNREHLLGRTIDYLDLQGAWRTFWQAFWPRQGLKHLYLRKFPRHLHRLRPEIIFTVLVTFGGGALLGFWGVRQFPLPVGLLELPETLDLGSLDRAVEQSGLLPSFSVRAILINNTRALLIAGGLAIFSLGMLPQLLLLVPMALIAYVAFQIEPLGVDAWRFIGAFVLPHGLLELPAAILATAQAMRMGVMILREPDKGGGVTGMLRELGNFLQLFIAVVLPLLAAAAWIEAQITPWVVKGLLQSL
jgi:uncharacterized membrane protein SpoIIM required for sporulation